jgi:DNA-binding MarR family transcriptional regulator
MAGKSRRQVAKADRVDDAAALADRLHSAAIHLLRRLREQDRASGLSGPRLSAMSVLVFGGDMDLSRLAAAEQVRLPTMSRLCAALVQDGLVARVDDPADARRWRLSATSKGRALLVAGRAARVAVLAAQLRLLSRRDRAVLARAAGLLAAMSLPASHPQHAKDPRAGPQRAAGQRTASHSVKRS